jgi:hypothetical protein
MPTGPGSVEESFPEVLGEACWVAILGRWESIAGAVVEHGF